MEGRKTLHGDVLQYVYDCFHSEGKWPSTRSLQRHFRESGNIHRIAAEIGAERIMCEQSQRTDSVCYLTISGLAECDNSAADVENFLKAVRYLAQQSLQSDEPHSVSAEEFVTEVGLSVPEAKRVAQILLGQSEIWSGASSSGDAQWASFTLATNAWYYEDVKTVQEYREAVERVADDALATATLRDQDQSKLRRGSTTMVPQEDVSAVLHNEWRGSFIDAGRIWQLRAIDSKDYDLQKLIKLCEELDCCYRNRCNHAVAALTRALIDHVPPILGCSTFSQVANNRKGTRSFRGSMVRLDESARKIADAHLHTMIRSKESLPTQTQVNFSQDIDVLLAEIVRILG